MLRSHAPPSKAAMVLWRVQVFTYPLNAGKYILKDFAKKTWNIKTDFVGRLVTIPIWHLTSSIHSSTFLIISSFISPLMSKCVASKSSMINFLSAIFWSFKWMMNCFMGASQVRRHDGDAEDFDLDFDAFVLDDDMVTDGDDAPPSLRPAKRFSDPPNQVGNHWNRYFDEIADDDANRLLNSQPTRLVLLPAAGALLDEREASPPWDWTGHVTYQGHIFGGRETASKRRLYSAWGVLKNCRAIV